MSVMWINLDVVVTSTITLVLMVLPSSGRGPQGGVGDND